MAARGADEQTAGNYERRAAEFSAWAEERANSEAAARARERFVACCRRSGKAPLQLLDLGCGSGRDVREFRRGGHLAVGVEPCAAFVQIARAGGLTVLHGGFSDLECWASEQLPAAMRAGVDGIFCLASIFHCAREQLPPVLGRLRRLLAPGGVLLTTLPCSAASSTRGADGRWVTSMPLAEHRATVQRAGFEVVEADEALRLYNGSWGLVIARRPGARSAADQASSAPLSRAEVEAVREQLWADDLGLEEAMWGSWSEGAVRAYFESGGRERPPLRRSPKQTGG